MDYKETLKLIEAGFTADEIRKMAEETPEDEKAPEDKKEPEGTPDEKKAPEVSNEMQALSEEIAKLNDTVSKMQEMNIKNARTGSPKAGDPVQEQINSFLKEL